MLANWARRSFSWSVVLSFQLMGRTLPRNLVFTHVTYYARRLGLDLAATLYFDANQGLVGLNIYTIKITSGVYHSFSCK